MVDIDRCKGLDMSAASWISRTRRKQASIKIAGTVPASTQGCLLRSKAWHILARTCFAIMIMALTLAVPLDLSAAVTPQQRKELAGLRQELMQKVPPLLKKKSFDEAEQLLDDIESRLDTLITGADWPENDTVIAGIRKSIETQRVQLAKLVGKAAPAGNPAGGKQAGTSFVKDVAPIFLAKCVDCHNAQEPGGGLRMDSYAALERGGNAGPNVLAQLIVERLTTQNPQQRMPKGGDPLPMEEVRKIADWLSAGAKFDGTDPGTTLSKLEAAAGDNKKGPAKKAVGKKGAKTNKGDEPVAADPGMKGPTPLAKPTGSETVSFIRDIAPTIVNTCGQCHNDGQKAGGLSMVTYQQLLQGGKSGKVITPGKLDESRLWRLVNADDTPVMPGGQARISRQWHANLRTWITEGAKFDGDAAKPLRAQIPSEEDLKREALAKLSPAEWEAKRSAATEAQWKRTLPDATPQIVTGSEVLLYGDVSEERLQQVQHWAEEQLKHLKSTFHSKEEPVFAGKLAIFVFQDRFGYAEFNNTIHRREVPPEIVGHAEVDVLQEDAFIAVQDVGDEIRGGDARKPSPGMAMNVAEQVTGAFLKRGGKLPDWLVTGAGISLANKHGAANNPYVGWLRAQAGEAIRSSISKPEDVFAGGTYSPSEVGPAGLALVEFLMKQGGPAKFNGFIGRLHKGDNLDQALKTVYQVDAKAAGTAVLNALPNSTGKKPNKK